MTASSYDGRKPEPPYHTDSDVVVDLQEQLDALTEERDRLRADLQRLQSSPAPVVGGVPKLTDEESARMKAVALSCGRHDANGELLCGSCKHSWREANLEDCDEGCSVGRVDLFFHGEPWQDCPDFASRLSSIKPGEVVVPGEYITMLESAANRFCSSCRESEGCTLSPRHLGGLGCGAWKLDGARINSLKSAQPTTPEKEG